MLTDQSAGYSSQCYEPAGPVPLPLRRPCHAWKITAVQTARVRLFTPFPPHFEYNFHIFWFLALGMASGGLTSTASEPSPALPRWHTSASESFARQQMQAMKVFGFGKTHQRPRRAHAWCLRTACGRICSTTGTFGPAYRCGSLLAQLLINSFFPCTKSYMRYCLDSFATAGS